MEPLHALEYELTSQLAEEIQRALLPWQVRRGWWREIPVFIGAAIFAALIVWAGLEGLILPGVGGGLMCVVMLFVVGAVFRHWATARGTIGTTLLALYTSDRRVRLEFTEERVRMETEYWRGEGTWSQLEDVVVFSGFWVLWLSNGGQIVIPAVKLSPELETFLRGKARDVMVPVRTA